MFRDAVTRGNHISLEKYNNNNNNILFVKRFSRPKAKYMTSYISKCVDGVMIIKKMKSFSNQKAWMNGVKVSRAKKAAFWSGDKEAYSTAIARLKAGIKEAKRRHQERDLNTNNPKDVWQVIQQERPHHARGHVAR